MSRNTQRDAQTHIKRLNSEKLIFPVNIFRTPDKLFNSVKNAESHDVKNWPDSLSGSKNFDNCVGSTNMRRWFLVKVRLIDFFYSTVILGCFSVWIYLILSEPTQFQPTQNHIFGHFFCVKRFPPFDKTGMNTMRIIRIWKLYFLRILVLSRNKIFYRTEKFLFSSERAQSADFGAIFGFKIEAR